jgi:hypothetical protein
VGGGGHLFSVMPGLGPGIHDESLRVSALRKIVAAENHHGLPGQARQ